VSIDTRLATLEADVAKALTVDTTRGRLAEDTIIEVPHIEPAEPDAKTGSILCEFTVKYRTKYNAPYASVYDPD
jgi:hypothetical protein